LLTTFDASTCSAGDNVCQFSSFLFAEFYATLGTVVGDGVASMQFGTRRLADNPGGIRSLQVGEVAATSAFDLSVQIKGADNDAPGGPGAYETAAGASMSTMFAAIVLVPSVLLHYFKKCERTSERMNESRINMTGYIDDCIIIYRKEEIIINRIRGSN
jgi:hypothetical protein